MKWIIRLVDHTLVHTMGLKAYWDHPQAMFRVRVISAPHALHLSDTDVPEGAPVLEMHFWNDHAPKFPPEGPDLAWAMKAYRMLRPSFRMLVQEVKTNPDLEDVRAFGGATVLVEVGGSSASEKLFRRLGLEIIPVANPMGRLGRALDNFYSWLLMWAYNDLSVRHRRLLTVRRSEAWMSREKFLRIHDPNGADQAVPSTGNESS
jgi:hypothetical protein